MKKINSFKLNFPSNSSNESFARVAVASFVALVDPTVDEVCDIKTAVSEAVTNCIVHGYRNTIGTVYIEAALFSDNTLTIRVKDKGCGIPDINKAMEPLFTTAGGERAGLGFAVMQSFMDSIKVKSDCSKGTTVIMKKRLSIRMKSNG